jgi:hypothetical protein
MVYLALTYDHRIVDGADAARFLTTVRERLEAGQFEGDLGLGRTTPTGPRQTAGAPSRPQGVR